MCLLHSKIERGPWERQSADCVARVQDAVVNAPAPRRVDPRFLRRVELPDGDVGLELPGVEEAVQRAVVEGKTFTELGLEWATSAR